MKPWYYEYDDSYGCSGGSRNLSRPRKPWYKRTAMKTKLLTLAALATALLSAQNQPVLGEETVKVSDHVWAIMGWPNIAIVVGSRAVLVVDTGLGPRNGATIARAAGK